MESFETVTNWMTIAGAIALLVVIVVSRLASYRTPKAAPVGPGKWLFALPPWVQIGGELVAIVLFVYLGYVLWIPAPLNVSPGTSMILRIGGLGFFLTGLFLTLWARWALGAMYGVSKSSAVQLQVQHRLIQRGPYAFVRHPMYLGIWLLLVGVTLIYRTWTPLVFLMMCLPSFYRRARREDVALAAAFGAEWQAYAARTKFLIPFVY